MVDENKSMRARSGEVNDRRFLVGFLYVLARDELPVGRIEELYDRFRPTEGVECMFTNGWLANWAKDMADRLGKVVEPE
jgi:hypothetical protein